MSINYVACDKCHTKGVIDKIDKDYENFFITTVWGLGDIMPCKITNVVRNFVNGVYYNIPICCNIHFCKMMWYNIDCIALVTSILRDDNSFRKEDYVHLSSLDIDYLKGKGVDLT